MSTVETVEEEEKIHFDPVNGEQAIRAGKVLVGLAEQYFSSVGKINVNKPPDKPLTDKEITTELNFLAKRIIRSGKVNHIEEIAKVVGSLSPTQKLRLEEGKSTILGITASKVIAAEFYNLQKQKGEDISLYERTVSIPDPGGHFKPVKIVNIPAPSALADSLLPSILVSSSSH